MSRYSKFAGSKSSNPLSYYSLGFRKSLQKTLSLADLPNDVDGKRSRRLINSILLGSTSHNTTNSIDLLVVGVAGKMQHVVATPNHYRGSTRSMRLRVL